ncbi:hypothetical protein ACWDV4_18980 [Micromonospora sp. NPDC003197]
MGHPSDETRWYASIITCMRSPLIRAGLLSETYSASGRDLIVLLVWCALALAISIRALIRRA